MAVTPIVAGADPQTRAALYRALREGQTSDPRVDALLRQWCHGWSRRRWLVPVAAMFNLIAIFFTDEPAARLLLGLSALFILLAAWQTERGHRQLRRYRGLVPEKPPAA